MGVSPGGPKPALDGQEFLTIDEVAAVLRLHPQRLRAMAKAGRLPGARRIGGQWRISRAELLGSAPPPSCQQCPLRQIVLFACRVLNIPVSNDNTGTSCVSTAGSETTRDD
jgi:excisionase family DNA binding protein